MKSRICRVFSVPVLAAGALLATAVPAFAHAAVSPPTAETGVLQQFTLAVPTELEGATTTQIQLTVPDGVAIDSFEASPGWKRTVQATGSGENAIINQVTWTGGHVPTEEDAVFHFQATLTGGSKDYVFQVRQTYSDGKVVEWNGAERLRHPEPDGEGRLVAGRRLQHARDRGGDSGRDRVRAGRDRALLGETLADVSGRARAAVLAVVIAAAGVFPAVASAHAVLQKTVPTASQTVAHAPTQVIMTFDEPVEPRFAVISVTDAEGRQHAVGAPFTPPGAADSVATDVHDLPSGWYLVYWRVISEDGHPVRGAFTFAVGPQPGPAPQFVIPSLSESAATPELVIARWAVFLSTMIAVGLFCFRTLIARRALATAHRARRALGWALGVAVAAGLVAIPVYIAVTTAEFGQLSAFDLGAILPLVRDAALGRALEDLELVLALFGLTVFVGLWIDRPERAERSVAELLALAGGLLSGAALLLIPGLAGHAAQTTPAALSLAVDWVHLVAGSVWLGGLIAVLLLVGFTSAEARLEVLADAVPRFSIVALGSVIALIASGVVASILHLPTLSSLWQTAYGKAILVKVVLLAIVILVAAINNRRSVPRLRAARRDSDQPAGAAAARLLTRTVGVELVLVVAIVVAAMVLTSLPPPAKALADVGTIDAHVGPGAVATTVHHGSYTATITIAPNKAAAPNMFALHLTQNGQPVTGATVVQRFLMLDMDMGTQSYLMREHSPGVYRLVRPALVMVGHWGLQFQIAPRGAAPFTIVLEDHAEG